MNITLRRWHIVPVLMFAGLVLGTTAHAQTALTPPPGSYMNTCAHEAMAGTTLVAWCSHHNVAGAIPVTLSYGNDTRLEKVYECVGDISIKNGALECNRGSFRQSCSGVVITPATYYGQHKIIAQCKKNDGTQASASLSANLWACNDVINDDGTLMCK
jgi:hypothetical protein